MKQLLGGLIVTLACACGGGSKPAATEPGPPPPSPCATMAEHATGEIFTVQRTLRPEQRPIVQRVLTERCEQDAWSDEIIACLSRARGEELERCGEMFSADHETALDREMEEALRGTARTEEEGRMGGKDRDDMEGGSGARHKGASPEPGDGVADDPCGGGAQK